MSDRSWAKIFIGGKLAHDKLILFEDVLYKGGFVITDYTELFNDRQQIELEESEMVGGMFEDLEAFCVNNGLSYLRIGAGHYTYDAEESSFTPPDKHCHLMLDVSGDAVIDLRQLVTLRDKGETLKSAIEMLTRNRLTEEAVPPLEVEP